MKRLITIIAFTAYTLQQLTCCCGSMHGVEELIVVAQAELNCVNEHDHDHDHGDEHEGHSHHDCGDSHGSQCPDGRHVCSMNSVPALGVQRVVVDNSPPFSVWANSDLTPPCCLSKQESVEEIDVNTLAWRQPSLEQLCVLMI